MMQCNVKKRKDEKERKEKCVWRMRNGKKRKNCAGKKWMLVSLFVITTGYLEAASKAWVSCSSVMEGCMEWMKATTGCLGEKAV